MDAIVFVPKWEAKPPSDSVSIWAAKYPGASFGANQAGPAGFPRIPSPGSQAYLPRIGLGKSMGGHEHRRVPRGSATGSVETTAVSIREKAGTAGQAV
jgi:hypothetical protein